MGTIFGTTQPLLDKVYGLYGTAQPLVERLYGSTGSLFDRMCGTNEPNKPILNRLLGDDPLFPEPKNPSNLYKFIDQSAYSVFVVIGVFGYFAQGLR
ncbi:hypothetical protein [Fimbriiglobus ruber]|uniref:hypothetical protein n=1 Tax=Fimbriiglobus ruber TaxID=1908690 RepID=UPI00117AE81F|nr:hypothetical protein [Fimbriiglobus ruber]